MSLQADPRAVVPPQSAADRIPATRPWRLARRHAVLLACTATLGVHLLSLTRDLGSDEGGFAMVGRWWHGPGPYLYGPQWVDRPPGLIALFALADHLGGYGVRLTASVLAVVLVASVAAAADAVGGRSAARWAAWTGFALASSVLLEAQRLNGELAAAAFVSASVAAVLRAVRVSPSASSSLAWGVAGGASATLAVLMKQNFVDGLAFAAVLLAAALATRRNRAAYLPRRVLVTAGGFLLGAVLPALVAAWWAHRHGGLAALLYAMYGFRADASAVMASWSWAAPLHRLGTLALIALGSGLLVLLAHLLVSHRRRLGRPDPLPLAVTAAAAVALVGVLGGENFWPHYLIGLVPMTALAAGLSVHRRVPGRRWTRRLVVAAALVTAVVSPVAAMGAEHAPSQAYTTGRWVADSARRTDTLVVPYTHADVIDASGLAPGYPYAWSLPVRTLDGRLSLLTRDLEAAHGAPDWVVRWDDPHTWGLDPSGRVGTALREHYRRVGTVCGHEVWLHDGLVRRPAPLPGPAACGTDGGS